MVTWEVKFCESRTSQQHHMWWGCQVPSRQPATQRVASFSAPLVERKHILSPCVYSLFSPPIKQWQLRTKTQLSCSLCTFLPLAFLLFSPILLFSQTGIGQGTINLILKQAEAQWIFPGLKGVLPSLGLFSFFSAMEKGCKLACRGVRLCWLQETDALQEFWKQTRLTLFSRPWLLFSLLCWRRELGPLKSSWIFYCN